MCTTFTLLVITKIVQNTDLNIMPLLFVSKTILLSLSILIPEFLSTRVPDIISVTRYPIAHVELSHAIMLKIAENFRNIQYQVVCQYRVTADI